MVEQDARRRGLEIRSSRRMSRINPARKRCCLSPASSSLRQRCGSQMTWRPAINWTARSIATISTRGRAARRQRQRRYADSTTKSIAKLFSSKRSMSVATVFSTSLLSQRSS